jgi:hypothetical protein
VGFPYGGITLLTLDETLKVNSVKRHLSQVSIQDDG